MLKTFLVAGAAAGATALVGYLGKLSTQALLRHHERHPVERPSFPGPEGPQKVAVVLNPSKNNAGEARGVIGRLCAEAGWEAPEFLETTVEDPGTGQARTALESGADVVLACGGDGTVRTVAAELAHTAVPLGVVPIGTGNILARNLRIDVADTEAAARTALFGSERLIDVGRIKVSGPYGSQDTAFMVMSGIGSDAATIDATHDRLKRHLGWVAYVEAGLRNLPGRRTEVQLSVDGGPFLRRKVRTVLFANCGVMPGGINFIADAIIDDGLLDVVIIEPKTMVGWLTVAVKVFTQYAKDIQVITFLKVREIEVRTRVPLKTQFDGDVQLKANRLRASVEPGALRVRVAA